MNTAIATDLAAFIAYSPERRAAVIAQMDAAHRAHVAEGQRIDAERAKAVRSAVRTADYNLDRTNYATPIALIYRAQDAERSITAGIIPSDIAELTAELARFAR